MRDEMQSNGSGLDRTPLFAEFENAQRILIAGAGGGFDVFSGLPLYFRLRAMGKDVHLANLSFSRLHDGDERKLCHGLTEVTADSVGRHDYFPEKYLCAWFRSRGEQASVWCFSRLGGRQVGEAYRAVAAELQVDAVVLVDGGTDSLMRGLPQGSGVSP